MLVSTKVSDSEKKQQEAKERATEYLNTHPNKGKGGTKDAEYDRILKEGGLTNDTYQKMINEDKKKAAEQKEQDREKEAYAYKESRKDIQEAAPKSVVDQQSARDIHTKSMNRDKPKVVGPTPQEDPTMIEKNELADKLYDTGYDYSFNEMTRHQNDGAENTSKPELYDAYGGYDNWYENHSLYSGNFTGSKDLMSRDEVMEKTNERQQFIKDYQLGEEFQDKYSRFSFAQNGN